MKEFILLVTLIFFGYNSYFYMRSDSACSIKLGDDKSPMIVQTGKEEFMYPGIGETNLTITSGRTIDLVCAGGKVIVNSESYDTFVTATCVSERTFQINSKSVEWREISCRSVDNRTARLTGKTCENNGKEVEIGFQVADRFLRTILVCFDESKQQALHSHANITASINQRNDLTPRPTFVQGTSIYEITSVNSYYDRSTQRKTINAALGLPDNSTKYIQNNNTYFLSKGHMTARSDNFYPAQQNASFFLPNVAPQWQTCNGANWLQVENYVRDYAEAHQVDLLEWTGVYGVTTLPHEETSEPTELYLYEKDGKKALPVPEFYWKVAYEPKSQKGIVLIVINNPYLSTYKPVCDDVSSEVTEFKWHKNSQRKGFGYICTVDTFRKVVTYLPAFTVNGLLI